MLDIVERLKAIDGEVGANQKNPRVGDGARPTFKSRPGERRKPVAILIESALITHGPAPPVKPELVGYRQARRPRLKLVGG